MSHEPEFELDDSTSSLRPIRRGSEEKPPSMVATQKPVQKPVPKPVQAPLKPASVDHPVSSRPASERTVKKKAGPFPSSLESLIVLCLILLTIICCLLLYRPLIVQMLERMRHSLFGG